MHAFLYNEKGVGLDLLQGDLQRFHLVLGQTHAQNLHIVPRIAAVTVPVGNAAVQLFCDGKVEVVGGKTIIK